MPDPPRIGEQKNKFISRCINHIVTKERKSQDEAAAICYSMWKRRKIKMSDDKYYDFTMTVALKIKKEIQTKKTVEECDECKTTHFSPEENTHRAIAIIGDRFMKGIFLPSIELKKAYKMWEGTLHDINHMGTSHLMGLSAMSDIRYFVGYQKNVSYDDKTKEVAMDIVIDDKTLHAETWHGYISLCEKAGKTPNVSVTFQAKIGTMQVKDLPKEVNYFEQGLSKDDFVEFIFDIKPTALSTVLRGACNDKDGCGIHKECKDSNCSDEEIKDPKWTEALERERQKLIKELDKEDENNE